MRKKIQDILEKESDAERAALKICEVIDDELALIDWRGKGWFDDDQDFQDWKYAAEEIK